jgi:hypothetical protein
MELLHGARRMGNRRLMRTLPGSRVHAGSSLNAHMCMCAKKYMNLREPVNLAPHAVARATIPCMRAQRGQFNVSQPALDALYRRLDGLEQQRAALTAGARGCEKASLMLGPDDRADALARLREITRGVPLQLDCFSTLRDSIEDDT